MKVEYLKSFLKDIQKLNNQSLKEQLFQAIENFKKAENLNDLTNIKKLKGHPEAFRMRISKYRLGFYFDGETIQMARFVKRETIYRLFP